MSNEISKTRLNSASHILVPAHCCSRRSNTLLGVRHSSLYLFFHCFGIIRSVLRFYNHMHLFPSLFSFVRRVDILNATFIPFPVGG